MTSGHFQPFPIDAIVVNREERQRKELPGIQELAWSLQAIGLINPIIIQRDGTLRAGERRFTAAKSLGWTHINVQFVEDLDEAELQLLELEENVRRIDLTWQEQGAAIDKYHSIRLAADPTWTQVKTAKALGLSQTVVSKHQIVAEEIKKGNESVKKIDKFSTAVGLAQRSLTRRKSAELEQAINPEKPNTTVPDVPLLNEDFNHWGPRYTGPKFNFIHCDFPYGINADKHDGTAAESMGGYDDSYEVYETLLATLNQFMVNGVAESAHLMFWFAMKYYNQTIDALTTMGWDVNRLPLVWVKSDNVGVLPDTRRGPRQIYETCLFASRGDRFIVKAVANAYFGPTTQVIHMSEKPVPMLTKFMSMVVDEYTSMLDPTAGSAGALKAAAACGAKSVLGLEKDPEFYKLAKDHYNV